MKLPLTQITMLMIMWMLMYLMKFKKKSNTKMMSPFECGYSPMMSKMPLSIQFTMLVIMFLLFDIELSILISSNWKALNIDKNWVMTMWIFFLFIMISIVYEMMKKSFKWI